MLVQARRTIATAVLLVGLSFAQQPPKEPAQPAFRVQTDLVTVPFQVRRGARSVSDLKPSDVVLLEDGVPRGFTIFEAPPVHLTLDLVVIFDVTTPDQKKRRVGFWDAKALQDLASYWTEAITRRLLDEHLDERRATIRFSIYRFDQFKLQRLCQSTSDPKVLLDALNRLDGRLTTSTAPGQNVDIPLPAGLAVRARERKAQAQGLPPQPWSLAGALSALKDSGVAPGFNEERAAADKAMAARALVIFSTGAEGTSITPWDLAEQAIASGVPVYPVALFTFPPVLPYDGYGFDSQIFYDDPYVGQSMWGPAGPYIPIWGPADRPNLPDDAPPVAPYFNYPFEVLGDLTGGRHFESVNHSQPLGRSGQRFVFDRTTSLVFSMTGGETQDIVERVKRHALARFSSNYTVGFVPSPSASPREHKLEVKLAPKSSGKVTEGKRSAIY
jgi:hypothetical protein